MEKILENIIFKHRKTVSLKRIGVYVIHFRLDIHLTENPSVSLLRS